MSKLTLGPTSQFEMSEELHVGSIYTVKLLGECCDAAVVVDCGVGSVVYVVEGVCVSRSWRESRCGVAGLHDIWMVLRLLWVSLQMWWLLVRGCSMASNRSCRSHCGSSVASAVTLAVAAVNSRRVLDGICSTIVTAVSANDYII